MADGSWQKKRGSRIKVKGERKGLRYKALGLRTEAKSGLRSKD